MKRFFYIFLSLLFFSDAFAGAKYTVTLSLASRASKELLAKIDEDTIVFICIEDTILRPKSKMFAQRPSNPDFNFIKNLAHAPDSARYAKAIADFTLKREDILVEGRWPKYIKEIKAKTPYIFGLYEEYPSVAPFLKTIGEKIYTKLRGFDIEFTQNILGKDGLPISKGESGAKYYKGILYNGSADFKKTVSYFLKTCSLNPKKIIIIGSNLSILKDIYETIRPLNLAFYGLYYAQIYNVKDRPDPEIVKLQKKAFLYKSIWLEDEEAAKFLKGGERAKPPTGS